MAKRVIPRPEWIKSPAVVDIYSVSRCVSRDFADFIQYWKHNGFWFFDSPETIRSVAQENSINLTGTTLFYYEVYETELDGETWKPFEPEKSFKTKVVAPKFSHLEGFDVVTFSVRTSPECSPLSCCNLAESIPTNSHCLLSSFEEAKRYLDAGAFQDSEPGPYRIFAVYSVAQDWPDTIPGV